MCGEQRPEFEIRLFDGSGGHNDVGNNHAIQGARGRRAEGQGYGLVLLAAFMLAVIGCFNLIYGFAALWGLCAYGSRENLAD